MRPLILLYTPWTHAVARQFAERADDPDFIRFLVLVARDGEKIPAGSGFYESL